MSAGIGPFRSVRGSLRAGLVAALAVLAVLVGGEVACAQQPAAGPSLSGRIEPAAGSGVPAYEYACTGEQQQRPRLRCAVFFDSPAQVESARVVERGGREWTSLFVAVTPSTDDSAFLFLIDRADPRRAATLTRVARDLREIVGQTGPRQQVAIATFGRTFNLLQSFSSDRQALQNAAGRIAPEGSTRELYRFMRDGITRLQAVQARQKFLVVISDGQSDDTEFTRGEVETLLRQANVRFIGVGVLEREGDRGNLQSLRRIAENPGNQFVEASVSTKELPAEIRSTFLTRFNAGGTLTAEAPSANVPTALDVTLRFLENRSSTFQLDAAAQIFGAPPRQTSTATPTPPSPQPGTGGSLPDFSGLASSAIAYVTENRTVAILVGVVLAIILVASVISLTRGRPQAPVGPAHGGPVPGGPVPGGRAFTPAPQVGATTPAPASLPDVHITPIKPLQGASGEGEGGKTRAVTTLGEPDHRHAMAFLEMNDAERRRIPISRNFSSIGRLEGENDIVLLDKNVSRVHAQLRVNDAGKWEIVNLTWERPEDKGGPNPISVNGEPIGQRRLLNDGDVVRLGNIGNTQFTFRSAVVPASGR